MATPRITHAYADGSTTTFEVECSEFIDGALTEAVSQVLRMYLEAVTDEAE